MFTSRHATAPRLLTLRPSQCRARLEPAAAASPVPTRPFRTSREASRSEQRSARTRAGGAQQAVAQIEGDAAVRGELQSPFPETRIRSAQNPWPTFVTSSSLPRHGGSGSPVCCIHRRDTPLHLPGTPSSVCFTRPARSCSGRLFQPTFFFSRL